MKSPFNWVGNKYKYINKINNLINKEYDKIIDVFMGSGNILLNLDIKANHYIGNDIIPLLTNIYKELIINNYQYDIILFNEICKQYNDFSNKQDYYNFRKDWNSNYKISNYNKNFILETLLLLKMCSNSMVRFNNKGEFNQGFRGCHGPFFNEITKNNIINELNNLSNFLQNKNYKFTNFDCLKLLDNLKDTKNNLIILDPPYISSLGMYNLSSYNKEKDLQILNYLNNTKNDFIYFNYLINENFEYLELKNFAKNYNVEIINDKTCSGQNRKLNVKSIKEVLIYKIS